MSSGNNFAKRQEDAKKKQSGQLPPDLDKDGKMINPHNPDFLTKVPWYLGDSGPSLKHHTIQKNDHVLSMQETDELIRTIKQGRKPPPGQSSFKIGACRNCGATTHKEKDCVERPRSSKRAAWKTGLDIAPSEVVLRLEDHGKVNYSAKRDNWQGYDPENYQETVEKFNRLEAERVRLKQESKAARKKAAAERKAEGKEEEKGESESDSDYDSDDHEEEGDKTDFIERDESARDFQGRTARQGGVGGAQHKVTVRNLRLREDTPKYLHNLDLESAFYDPKARSMRENPLPDRNQEDVVFAGDNFIRQSGDSLELARTQVLCWDMQANGADIDLVSNPSQAFLMKQKHQVTKAIQDDEKKKALLAKYGGDEHLEIDARLRLGQTEAYREYSRDGRVIKGADKASTKTKYEEDVFINNHTSVWGSYFNRNQWGWGYACCHSLVKNSYCIGAANRNINDKANKQAVDGQQARRMLESIPSGERKAATAVVKRSDLFGESSATDINEDKLKAALLRQEEFEKQSTVVTEDDRKRTYNSMQSVEMSVEDMEAYRMKKVKRDDPMAALLNADTLLEYTK